MTKENFLIVRWNNYLSLEVGLPTLIYTVVAFSTSIWSGGRLDRTFDFRGAFLTGYRISYSHAVRVASGKNS